MKAFRTPARVAIAHGLRGCLVASIFTGLTGLTGLTGCGLDSPDPSAGPTTATTSNALSARPADPARAAALVARARSLVRPGSVVQAESRLGVPTFLWTREAPAPAPALAAGAPAGGVVQPEAAARALLADYAPLYGLGDSDIADAVVTYIDHGRLGPVVVKLHAELGGVEIFGE
ncbi:MAG TPA: hypothetical protein VGD37_25230, partial [Kofleriaceae bacterium]